MVPSITHLEYDDMTSEGDDERRSFDDAMIRGVIKTEILGIMFGKNVLPTHL